MAITAKNISKAVAGATILHDLSFDIEDGAFATFLGATGAGKTSLLRVLAGLDRPDRGQVLYDGQDLVQLPRRNRPVAMVYQEFINYPSLTIYENIASPLRVAKPRPSKQEVDTRVRQTAEMMGLTRVLDHRPDEVSGGQQQRTAIARALAKGAKYIFLDEPLANLDYKLREELRGELKRIFRDRGGAVVYATAEPIDALSMATHVGYMHEGRLLQYGPARDVYNSPASVEVGQYFSYPTMNILNANVTHANGTARLKIGDDIEVEAHGLSGMIAEGPCLAGVRAHAFSTRQGADDLLAIRARVELTEVVGSDTELHLDYRGQRLIALLTDFERHDIGEDIDVFFHPREIFVFHRNSRELAGKTLPD